METLPDEILHKIADFGAYYGLVNSYRRYAMLITDSVKMERMVAAGVSITVSDDLIEWKMWGYTHRVDGPAHIHSNGEMCWYRWGVLHREDGPAQIQADGRCEYYRFGALHNDNGPAVNLHGLTSWWFRGCQHRVGAPAFVSGSVIKYYYHGVLHREDGPAEYSGDDRYWYLWGKLHRIGGPAVEKIVEGVKILEFWEDGKLLAPPIRAVLPDFGGNKFGGNLAKTDTLV